MSEEHTKITATEANGASSDEQQPQKEIEISNAIQAIWHTEYVTTQAIEKRKQLAQVFNGTEFVAVPFGSLIAAANDQSDFDLLIYGTTKWHDLKVDFSILRDTQYKTVVIDSYDFPGEISNAYDLRPQRVFNIPAIPNILLTPDTILAGDLKLASAIRLAVVHNMKDTGHADLDWEIMTDEFLAYFTSSKFLSSSGIEMEQAIDLTKRLKTKLPSFQEYLAYLEKNDGRVI